MKNEKLLNTLLKGVIIAAGTGVGMLLSRCFSVEETLDGEPNEPEEIIDADYTAVEEPKED